MKITSKNTKYAVVRTAFHGGGVVSVHKSLAAAEKAAKKYRNPECSCGCCAVAPITDEARKEMPNHGRDMCGQLLPLLEEIPEYTGNEFSPYVLRR
jgi:hypothetical protein